MGLKAWLRVRSNKGSGEVDGISLAEFSQDYKMHQYRLWNRMNSGSYMLPAVKLMEIRKRAGADDLWASLPLPTAWVKRW